MPQPTPPSVQHLPSPRPEPRRGLEVSSTPAVRRAGLLSWLLSWRLALHRFLEDGRLRLDINCSEGALRWVKLGEANWKWFANEVGAKWYRTFRSLTASCRL